VPAVAVTAQPVRELAPRLAEAGFRTVLAKPVDGERLADAVRRCLDPDPRAA
jgi:CheY-like chemotaxis protein